MTRSIVLSSGVAGLVLLLTSVPVAAQQMIQGQTPTADALAAQMRVLGSNPRDVAALISAGDLSTRLGDYAAALSFFARAQAIDPGNPRIAAGRAGTLVALQRPGEALQLYALAERNGAAMEPYLMQRGLAYDLIGQPGYAQRDYRRALTRGTDDETVRRLALSLGISGQRDEALQVLDPLLRRSDRAAWRARAFVLAMTGDLAGAQKIATSMMVGGAAMTPFFGRLAALSPADRAFAVHFGEIGTTIARVNDARLAPALAPFQAPVRVASAPVQVAATETRVASAERRSRRSERNVARPGRTAIASTTPAPVTPVTSSAASTAAISSGTSLLAVGQGSVRPGEPISGAPLTQVATNVAATPPARTPSGTSLLTAEQASVRLGAPISGAPVTLASSTMAPASTATRPVTAVSPATAEPLTSVQGQSVAPVSVASAANVIAALPAAPTVTPAASSLVVTPGPTSSPAVTGQSVGITLASTPIPSGVPSSPSIGTAQPVTPASTTTAAPVEIVTLPQRTPPAPVASAPPPPPAPVRTPEVARRNTQLLASIIETIDVPASELEVEPVRAPAAVSRKAEAANPERKSAEPRIVTARTEAAADAKKTSRAGAKATDAKASTADIKVADAKAAADAKTKAGKKTEVAKAAAKTPDPAKSDPQRWWVQVAGGANADDLDKDWKRLTTKSASAFKGKSAYTTPLRATNRLLTGPFKSQSEAMAFVNQLAKGGTSAFAWQSPAGQKISKLGAP